MKVLPIILLIAALVALAVYMVRRKRRGSTLDMDWVANVQAQIAALTATVRTPGGVIIRKATPASEAMQAAVDAEFAEMMALAARIGYTNRINPTDYTILVFPSERDYDSNNTYSPSFRVYFGAGDSYDESPFDQMPGQRGGWLYAAEWVIDIQNCFFVIADNNSDTYTRSVVEYGLDHILLYHNDRALYEETKDHSQGGGHPILKRLYPA